MHLISRHQVQTDEELAESLKKMETNSPEAQEEAQKLVGYLTNNGERVNYGRYRRVGYPIGSGGIESANKYIGGIRLKRSGAWWYGEKANEMLALRGAIYNGTYEKVFASYKERALNARRSDKS